MLIRVNTANDMSNDSSLGSTAVLVAAHISLFYPYMTSSDEEQTIIQMMNGRSIRAKMSVREFEDLLNQS